MIEVKLKKFHTRVGKLHYRLLSTKEERSHIVNINALSGYVKSYDKHPNCEVFLLEVPYGYVKQTRDFVKKHNQRKDTHETNPTLLKFSSEGVKEMRRLWAILNDEGKISVMEKTETGLTCLKWVKDNDELEEYLKTIEYSYIMKDF